jgi:hypothetical protein
VPVLTYHFSEFPDVADAAAQGSASFSHLSAGSVFSDVCLDVVQL